MRLSQAEARFHRQAMAQCFNEAWEYLEKKRRDPRDDRRMLDLAHTSRYHSEVVGTPRNRAIGDWQISRAYAALGEARLALRFAESALRLCEEHALSDILCTAFEGLARAHAVNNELSSAETYLARAREQLDRTPLYEEDREIYLGQIRETARLARRRSGRPRA